MYSGDFYGDFCLNVSLSNSQQFFNDVYSIFHITGNKTKSGGDNLYDVASFAKETLPPPLTPICRMHDGSAELNSEMPIVQYPFCDFFTFMELNKIYRISNT